MAYSLYKNGQDFMDIRYLFICLWVYAGQTAGVAAHTVPVSPTNPREASYHVTGISTNHKQFHLWSRALSYSKLSESDYWKFKPKMHRNHKQLVFNVKFFSFIINFLLKIVIILDIWYGKIIITSSVDYQNDKKSWVIL